MSAKEGLRDLNAEGRVRYKALVVRVTIAREFINAGLLPAYGIKGDLRHCR
jgi:hypothetical protein